MLTALGRELRKIRIDHGEVLNDMAITLGISPSYLSAIECGKRNIPTGFVQSVIKNYDLNESQIATLYAAEVASVSEARIDLSSKTTQQRDVAILLSRRLDSLSSPQLDALIKVINSREDNHDLVHAPAI